MKPTQSQMQDLIGTMKRAPSITEASKKISDAGITDEYLAHCLLYESEAMVWAAWSIAASGCACEACRATKNQRSR